MQSFGKQWRLTNALIKYKGFACWRVMVGLQACHARTVGLPRVVSHMVVSNMEDKETWRAVLLPRGKLQRISLGHDFLGCRRGGFAIGRAAAGSPGTLLS